MKKEIFSAGSQSSEKIPPSSTQNLRRARSQIVSAFNVTPESSKSNLDKLTSVAKDISEEITHHPSHIRGRRLTSAQESLNGNRCFLVNVQETLNTILAQEDTDGDCQITVKDIGPKTMLLGSEGSQGFRKYSLRGTYAMSNLLQELSLAKDKNLHLVVLAESRLTENPVLRLARMIRIYFWPALTRALDKENAHLACADPKNRSINPSNLRLYLPFEDSIAHEYYKNNCSESIEICILPKDISTLYIKSLDNCPGILSLALFRKCNMHENSDTGLLSCNCASLNYSEFVNSWKGVPFVVPGGRFNEMYGWDSYFESLGLITVGKANLSCHMVDNFCYQIHYYGKILNANRTYYLSRSQPPFLTDMAISAFNAPITAFKLTDNSIHTASGAGRMQWLARVLMFAVREYYTVWTAFPRFDSKTKLSFYKPTGIGMPPETEATHFMHLLKPFADRENLEISNFIKLYNEGSILIPELDNYFAHDRAVRESGHDTTYRLEKRCASLLTVDLNSLLYKYESDIADLIEILQTEFLMPFTTDIDKSTARIPVPHAWIISSGMNYFDSNKDFTNKVNLNEIPTHFYIHDNYHSTIPAPLAGFQENCIWEDAGIWKERAKDRRKMMTNLMWDEESGFFFDFDVNLQSKSVYSSATTFWTMWAGVALPEHAKMMVERALPRLEMLGGLVSGTEESRGKISLDRPNRQWDYPFGWAPHQILAWKGLSTYGYSKEAKQLAYRWLFTITKAFVDFNGVVPEKFDVVTLNHIINVEYGNVGTDFKCVPREGFGWMNASYSIGLEFIGEKLKKYLGAVSPPDIAFRADINSNLI